MLLDKNMAPALVRVKEEGQEGYEGVQHWVGGNGEWLVMIHGADPGKLTLTNVYRSLKFTMPSLEGAGITHYKDRWQQHPFAFNFNGARINLLKIQLPKRPFLAGGEWSYDAIAVFDKVIAIIRWPRDKVWTILPHTDSRPSKCVDAVGSSSNSERRTLDRIYAVTEPHGDVHVWQPFE